MSLHGREFITRKEYDERHTALQLQITELIGVQKANADQIKVLIAQNGEQNKAIGNLELQVAKLAAYSKLLWPIITASASVIFFLIGIHV